MNEIRKLKIEKKKDKYILHPPPDTQRINKFSICICDADIANKQMKRVYIYSTLPLQTKCDTRSIFKWSRAGFNSVFFLLDWFL